MPPDQVWIATLNQLQLQMTRGTYDTWLKDTSLIVADNGMWQVAVNNEFAKDWLDHRLRDTIERVAESVAGRQIAIEFLVQGNGHPPLTDDFDRTQYLRTIEQETVLAFDVESHGYAPHPHYIQRYWGAFIGAEAMQVYNFIRSFYTVPRYLYDKQAGGFIPNPDWTPWTAVRPFRAANLARAIESKDKKKPNNRKVTGGWRTCHKYDVAYQAGEIWPVCCCTSTDRPKGEITHAAPTPAYPQGRQVCRYWDQGVLEKLANLNILIWDKRVGTSNKPRTTFYNLQVYLPLPLLAPAQVATLDRMTQGDHQDYLQRHRVNLQAWHSFGDTPSLIPLVLSRNGATINL